MFWLGIIIGVLIGLVIASLLGMAHRSAVDQEIAEAYQHGFKAGKDALEKAPNA
jgi:uncharacterized membrane-anchored protein YhcB (DUF1043 family)